MADKIEKYKKSSHSIRQIVFLALSVIAILCIVLSIGKYLSPPWVLGITTEDIGAEKITEDFGVIIDKSESRLSYLDGNKNVTDIKTPYSTGGDLFFYSNVDFNDNSVFIVEYCYYHDSHFLKQEKIAQYNRKGEKVSDLVSYSYDLDENYANMPRIKSMSLSDSKLYFTYYDALHNSYSINSINLESGELAQETHLMQTFPNPCTISALFSVDYDCVKNQLYAADCLGNVYIANAGDVSFAKMPDNIIQQYNLDETGSALMTNQASVKGDFLKNGESCSYSLSLAFRIISFWLSLAYFIVLAIVGIVLFIKKNKSKDELKKLKVPIIMCLSILIAIGVIIYINSYSEKMQFDSQEEAITQNVQFVNNTGHEKFVDLINSDINSEEYKSKETLINS